MEIIRFHKAIKGPRKNQVVVTECLIKKGDRVGVGLALRSLLDEYKEDDGVFWAKRRAKAALKNRGAKPIVREEAQLILNEIGFSYHSVPHKSFRYHHSIKKACELEQKFLEV